MYKYEPKNNTKQVMRRKQTIAFFLKIAFLYSIKEVIAGVKWPMATNRFSTRIAEMF